MLNIGFGTGDYLSAYISPFCNIANVYGWPASEPEADESVRGRWAQTPSTAVAVYRPWTEQSDRRVNVRAIKCKVCFVHPVLVYRGKKKSVVCESSPKKIQRHKDAAVRKKRLLFFSQRKTSRPKRHD